MSKSITPNKIEIEVYFEGIVVPVQSISINEQLGVPPSAKISMPAHSGALRMLPGTMVHIFGMVERSFYITTSDTVGIDAASARTKDSANSSVREKVLLFEGEITGQSYSKDPSNRAVSITAQGLLAKWAQVYMHSADLMSDRLLFSALYVYQDWNDIPGKKPAIVLDADGNEIEAETAIEPLSSGDSKYARFEYSNSTTGIDSLESWLITAMDGPKADKEAYARGDLMPFFQDLMSHLEYLNLYYGLFAKTYRISESVFTFPNYSVISVLELLITNNYAGGTPTGMAEQITLIDILFQILSLIGYTMLMPAAPTHTVHPYKEQKTAPHNGLSDQNEIPMRAFMLPDMKFSVPALTNVLFPDEVERFDFSRNMAGEPTRLFMGISPTSLKYNSTTLNDIAATYVVPGLPIFKPKNDTSEVFGDTQYHFGFTPEEQYRGVHPLRANFSGLENAFIQSLLKPPGESSSGEGAVAATMSPDNKMGALAYNTASNAFHSARLSTRSCSFETMWNPFRLVGLPALYFDMDGSPSIMGVLSSVSTNIDAQGSARQSLVVDMARVIYDLGGKDRIEDLLPSLVDGTDIHTKKRETVDEEVLQYNSLHADKLPWLPAWYDKNWYGHDHVGRDVYSIMTAGTRALYTTPSDEDDTVTKHDSAWTNKDAQPAPSFSEEVRDRYNKNGGMASHFGTKIDYSIFNFIRTGANGWFKTPSGEDALLAIKEDDIEEHVAAKRIAHAIRVLKRSYKEAQIGGREKGFILKTTSRRLVPKVKYWAFLGVKAAQIGDMTEDHDLTSEMLYGGNAWKSLWAPSVSEGELKSTVQGMSVTRCKTIMDNFFNDTLTWEQAMQEFELHPFIAKRRDHVLTMSTLVGLKSSTVTR